MDWILVLETRWFVIAAVVAVMAGYLVLMDFRRFLAVVCMNIVFYFMWEGIALGRSFPFFPMYVMPSSSEFLIGTIPASILFLKGAVYATGSYLVSSMACREFTHGRIDLVKNRGNRVNEHIAAGMLASIVYTTATMVVEPVLANGEFFGIGRYEKFVNGAYFGVDPLFFLGSLITSAISFTTIAVLDSNIRAGPDHVLFDYDTAVRSPRSYHQFAFGAFWASMIIPALLSSVISPMLVMLDIVAVIPATAIAVAAIWWASSRKDGSMVRDFCSDHPDSFICKM